jgi:hypothetical protein
MSLRSYRPATYALHVAGSDPIRLRGITVADLSMLYNAYSDDFAALFAAFTSVKEKATDRAGMNFLALELVQRLPDLAAALIACAADEPDAKDAAASLPFPAQVTALTEIARMTFEASGGLGNFLASLDRMMSGLGVQSRPVRSDAAAT